MDEKLIASNPSARGNYILEEIVEAGLMLTGTEIKSIRKESPALKDAWVEIQGKAGSGKVEAWLVGLHIGPYSHGNIWNHEPERKRKLLLHRHQIDRIQGAITREGRTTVPTRMYFKKGRVKVEIAIAKGKKKHDRRDDHERRGAQREMDRAMKQSSKKGK